jgi:hypothetical protein
MTRTLDYPLYANKPKRHLPNSDVIVVTMYRSTDGTVAEYALFTDDDAYLGCCYYHPKRAARSAGYSMESVFRYDREWWPNLASFAADMKRRHGITTEGA